MKKKSDSKRVVAYVQGRHHKKPVRIFVGKRRERRERERIQARSVWWVRRKSSKVKNQERTATLIVQKGKSMLCLSSHEIGYPFC